MPYTLYIHANTPLHPFTSTIEGVFEGTPFTPVNNGGMLGRAIETAPSMPLDDIRGTLALDLGIEVTFIVMHPSVLEWAPRDLLVRLGASEHPGVHDFSSALARAFARRERIPTDAASQLNQLLDSPLKRSVRALAAHTLNTKAAARALYVHRNTLLYRIDKIEEACGLKANQFYDALILTMLLA